MSDTYCVPSPHGWLSITDAIFHNARRRPRHAAIIEGSESLTYAALATQVRQTAGYLGTLGVKPGDVVGVALKDNTSHLVALLAVACFGAVILPMDVRWLHDEKTRVASHFGAQIVLVEDGAPPLPGIKTVALDESWGFGVAQQDTKAEFMRRRDQPVVLSLSSGTTGTPKGPMVTHGHVLNRLMIYGFSLTFNEADRFLCATPLYFGGGRYMNMAYLFMGATVVLNPPPYQSDELLAAIAHYRITALFLVPTLLRRLLELPKSTTPLLPTIRLLISSGSVLHPDERQRIMQELSPNFYNFYSSTEGGGVSVLRPDHPLGVATSVGQVVFGTEVQIADDHHNPLPDGTVGNIRYRGGTVADSFYRDPEASKAAFHDGWYYPGDIGRLDTDGFLFLTGRRKDMIIRGGVNIYPTEIEEILMWHPCVAEAAVVAWPHPSLGEEVAAFVVYRTPITEAALIEHCRLALAVYKVPKIVQFVPELPKSGMGKVLKAELAAQLPVR